MVGSRFLTAAFAVILLAAGATGAHAQATAACGGVQVPAWASEARPSTPNDGTVGFNRAAGYCERYSAATGQWVPSISGGDGSGLNVTATGGTVSRTQATRAADVVNVLDKGADPTGAVDSSTAINAAITTACAANPHKSVYIPYGKYLIVAANVSVSCSPMTVRGDGATLIAGVGNTLSPNLFRVYSQTSGPVSVRGLTFDGGAPALCPTNKGSVVTMAGSARVVFSKDVFQNTCGLALQFSTNIKYSGVEDSVFTNIGMYWHTSGLLADAKQALVFTDVPISGWTAAGASLGNFARNNSFDTLGFDAISVFYNASVDISGNTILPGAGNQWYDGVNGNACVYGVANRGMTVTNNQCVSASGNGFDLDANGYAIISGNYISSSGINGMSVSPGRGFINTLTDGDVGTSLVNNTIVDSGQNGAVSSSAIALLMKSSGAGPQTIANTNIVGNKMVDDQTTKTQKYDVLIYQSPTVTNLTIQGNSLGAAAVAPISPQPALSACGTSPSMDALATDLDGTITVGTGTVTSCTMTFSAPFTTAPRYTLTTGSATAFAAVTAISPTAATFTFSADLGGKTVTYHAQ